ncbi:MAG: DUF1992 domain-containing protein [Thermodesulfobacteriota bacterium]
MEFFERLAEERIRAAMNRGEFTGLTGAGRPLKLEDDSAVPVDLRLAFKILKNAGFLPAELELKKEIHQMIGLLMTIDDEGGTLKLKREIDFKIMKFNMAMKRPLNLDPFPEYAAAVHKKLSGKGR